MKPKTKRNVKNPYKRNLFTASEWIRQGYIPLPDAVGIKTESTAFYSKKECQKLAPGEQLFTAKEWFERGWVPLRGAVGLNKDSEIFYTQKECEEVISGPEANRRGLRILRSVKPVGERQHKRYGNSYFVFRVSDCVPKIKRKEIPPVEIDVLLATFTVNKSAKRYRDAASGQYKNFVRQFAKNSSKKKTYLYSLKDRGILAAVRAGRLTFCGLRHNLAIYRGEGYCFHSTLVPEGADSQAGTENAEEFIFVESAPKGSREGRLKDAEYTLSKLSEDETGFRKLPAPKRLQKWGTFLDFRPKNKNIEKTDDEDDSGFDDDDDW